MLFRLVVPGTRIKAKDVLGVDDTLLTHYGQSFDPIAKLYDHVTGTYVWAHNLVNLGACNLARGLLSCPTHVSFGLDLERVFCYTGYPHNAVGMYGAD